MIVARPHVPNDALEGRMARFETKRHCRRLVKDFVFTDCKLIRHDWRGHYSITSSARASNIGGIDRPSSFAVFKLMISSILSGWMTGKSAGFSPFSTLAT